VKGNKERKVCREVILLALTPPCFSSLFRLSGDVQEFKSSFKLVIGQGLRSVTQVVGCAGSLLLISPYMTVSMGVALPAMIAVGTILGQILRRWSRQSQEQVAIAMGVADEALGNVRTVRSFAMEDTETQ